MNKGEGNPAVAAPPIFFPAIVTPQGDGSFVVRPGKPIVGEHWVGTAAAQKILGLASRGSMHALRNSIEACKIIRWKYTTPAKGKVFYEVNSLWDYRRKTEGIGK